MTAIAKRAQRSKTDPNLAASVLRSGRSNQRKQPILHGGHKTNDKGAPSFAPPCVCGAEAGRASYLFRLRIAANPPHARSSVNAIIAHSESVGMFVAVAVPTTKIDAADEAVLLPPLVCKAPTGTVLR
jgi:hypothetical protein